MKPYTLITGASSGIGKALATIAAENGHNLVLVARSKTKLEAHASKLNGQHGVDVVTIACDLSKPESPTYLANQLEKRRITIGSLINNAGFGDYGPFDKSDLPRQTAMIQLNISTLTELTRLFLPQLKQQSTGYIMNIGSVASFLPGPLMSVYFASKAYVLSFSEALSEELRDTNVSVTCFCPGSTSTGFGESAQVSDTHSTRTSNVTARQVAEAGWKAMIAKKPVAIYGIGNKFALFLVKFLPRWAVRRLVHHIQK